MKNLSFDKQQTQDFLVALQKPDGWSLNKINKKYLGRYHRIVI